MDSYLNQEKKVDIEHEEDAGIDKAPGDTDVARGYAVDPKWGQMTVAQTMGQDPDHRPHIPAAAWAVLALCALAQFQNVFIGIAPASNSYSIAGALPNGMAKRLWIVQAQGIPSIATGPIMSIFADLYGRKYVVLGCYLLFIVGAVVGMTTKSANTLIIAQALVGSAAGMSGLNFAIASEVMPSKYRSHAQTFINLLSGLASIPALLGVTGAVVADPVNGWRWLFRIELILAGILFLGFLLVYKPPPRTEDVEPWTVRFKRLDWIGYFLLVAGLVPLLMGFAWAGDRAYGWKDPHAYGCVAAGFVGFAACLIWEWKGTSTGFLHHALFAHGRNFPICVFVIAVEGSLFYLLNNVYASQVFTLWVPTGGIKAATYLLPFFTVIFGVAPFMSWYVTKRSDIKWPICAGFLLFSASMVGFGLAGLNGKIGLIFNAVAGIAFCSPLILVMTMVQLSTPPLLIGVASALTISARTLGGVVGYGIADVIYNDRVNARAPGDIAAAVIPLGFNPQYLGDLIGALFSHAPTTGIPTASAEIVGAASAALANAQAYGFKITWLAFLPGSVIAAAACACFRNPVERMNWIVDAPLDVHSPAQAGAEESLSSQK